MCRNEPKKDWQNLCLQWHSSIAQMNLSKSWELLCEVNSATGLGAINMILYWQTDINKLVKYVYGSKTKHAEFYTPVCYFLFFISKKNFFTHICNIGKLFFRQHVSKLPLQSYWHLHCISWIQYTTGLSYSESLL